MQEGVGKWWKVIKGLFTPTKTSTCSGLETPLFPIKSVWTAKPVFSGSKKIWRVSFFNFWYIDPFAGAALFLLKQNGWILANTSSRLVRGMSIFFICCYIMCCNVILNVFSWSCFFSALRFLIHWFLSELRLGVARYVYWALNWSFSNLVVGEREREREGDGIQLVIWL